jgi:peptidoglycan/xylan/chitin deacetylase (PgdA/CDA1 family)
LENAGALVISLDFELHWGMRDLVRPDDPYRANLLGAREAVPRMLELFARHGVAATWATVGMLFARDRDELEGLMPEPDARPRYHDRRLDPYGEAVGRDERVDPLHYARSLIERVRETPRQEIASHTFSHFYCLEPGQTREAFRADLAAAKRASSLVGIELRSLVLPRNQLNPEYADEIVAAGFRAYRGNAAGWMYRPKAFSRESAPRRAARLLDAYFDLSGAGSTAWSRVRESSALCNVAASRFLRPPAPRRAFAAGRRGRRAGDGMRHAARAGELYHLWWHPHNFGVNLDENLRALDAILRVFGECKDAHGMRSLTMAEAAEAALA